MKRTLAMVLSFVLIAALFTGCGPKQITQDTVVATIDGQEVYAYEVEYMLNAGLTTREKALDELKRYKVLAKIAADNSIALDDTDKQQIASQREQLVQQYGSEEALNTAFKSAGLTSDIWNKLSELFLLGQKTYSLLISNGIIAGSTDEELKAYYDENFLRAKHILFSTMDTATNTAKDEAGQKEAETKANETVEKIKAGQPFEDFLNLSEDPGAETQPDGYLFVKTADLQTQFEKFSSITSQEQFDALSEEDQQLYEEIQTTLQTLQYGGLMMAEEFEAGTLALQPGEVSSQPVKSSFGYHIIQRLDINEKPELFDSAKEKVKEIVDQKKVTAALAQWEKDAKVKIKKSAFNAIALPTPVPSPSAPTTATTVPSAAPSAEPAPSSAQ